MKYRRFGMTGMTVSELGFGCARLGGVFQSATKAEMLRTVASALDSGITFFDTSDMYCHGESEEPLGAAFQGKREKVIIASKVGYCLPTQKKLISRIKPLVKPVIQRLGIKRAHIPVSVGGSLSQNFSPAYIMQAIDHSLRRLKTDYLDLYQLHSPPPDVLEDGGFLEPLERLKQQGKIRHYGISCETTRDIVTCLRYPEIASIQLRLSLLDQSALADAIPQARSRGVALIARECFAGSLLAKPADALNLEEIIADEAEREAKRREILGYHRLAEQMDRTLPEMSLQFVLGVEGLSLALVGLRTETHLADNLRLLEGKPLSAVESHALAAVGAA